MGQKQYFRVEIFYLLELNANGRWESAEMKFSTFFPRAAVC